jgi:hypothetical protein
MQVIRDLIFDLNIFRVLPDAYSGNWCLELRDPNSRKGEWVTVPQDPLMPTHTLFVPDSHTFALAAYAGNEIVLGTFADAGMPWFQAYTAWLHQSKIWHYPNANALEMTEQGWNIKCGADTHVEPFRNPMPLTPISWISPSILPVNEIPAELLSMLPKTPVKQVEYIFWQNAHCISFHTANHDGTMDQYLMVCKNNTIEFCEMTETGVRGFSLDTWCIRNGILCLMRGGNRWQMLAL